MHKPDTAKYALGSAEYIVLHAAWRRSRGQRPSEGFLWAKNPRAALELAERFAYFPEHGEYLSGADLSAYVCAQCGASGCKLWREYQTFSPTLLCAACAAKSEGKDITDIDAEGKRSGKFGDRTDQIGWYVPAVPTEDGCGYWGYTSVPNPGCKWWKGLPTLPQSSGR